METDLIQRLNDFSRARVAVLGDFLIDEFIFGEISRVSREAPVLILKYQETQVCPGGAANTVANAAALGASVYPIGIIGDDRGAEELGQLWDNHVRTEYLIREKSVATTRKSRILAGSFHSYRQQVVRMDYEAPVPRNAIWEARISHHLEEVLRLVDALIISDYSLGNVTAAIRQKAGDLTRQLEIPLIIDSRDHPEAYPGATTVTPNITEVEKALGHPFGHDREALEHYGELARRRWKVKVLLMTRGKMGMSVFSEGKVTHLPAFGSQDAVDVTGAGDTVAASYTTALASGADFESAARLANIAGGLAVMKKGTSTVSAEELRTALMSHDGRTE